ncbi:MAG: serine/threonine-protein kinase [Eubacteriales bacterium]|nr:serine/threonine-protein kinase [Eubacteriales bacterium]
MAGNDSTIREPGATVPEGIETVYENGAVTITQAALTDATRRGSAVVENLAIQKGMTLLETYRVESDAIEGGMGSVWRVRHTGWNVDLAMKRPQPQCFSTEKSKADFIRECEAWINLGLHPNIVSCYYVREIGGTPTIFSEWMNGGSLENAVKNEALYQGTQPQQQERILDIAIQFARGLHYAHEAGLIHQDVKPDNLLLTKEGDAKVADFGLARARAVLTVRESAAAAQNTADSGKTILSPSGGYTPAYCSMEQMDGRELTRRTDIYSWAVSVMELYLGSCPWANGVVAGLKCRDYFEQSRLPMPEALKELLAQCMESEPEKRPHDFAEVEVHLLESYRLQTGKEHRRLVPRAVPNPVGVLNNKALSYLDLGMEKQAEAIWRQGLNTNPNHLECNYNYSLYKWRNRRITDREALEKLPKPQNQQDWPAMALRGQLFLESGAVDSAVKLLTEAAKSQGAAPDTIRSRDEAKARNINPLRTFMIRTEGLEIKPDRGLDTMILGYAEDKSLVSIRAGKPVDLHGYFKGADYTRDYKGVLVWERMRKDAGREHDFWIVDKYYGKVKTTFHGHNGKVYSVAESLNGTVLSASADGSIGHWNLLTGKRLSALEWAVPEGIKAWFVGGGRFLVAMSGTQRMSMTLYDPNTGKKIRDVNLSKPMLCANDSEDGKYLCFGCGADQRNEAVLLNLETGKRRSFSIGQSKPGSIAISPDGTLLAVGAEKEIMLFETPSGRCIRTISLRRNGRSSCVGFEPTGNYLLIGSPTGFVFADEVQNDFALIPLDFPAYQAPWALSGIVSTNQALKDEVDAHGMLDLAREALDQGDLEMAWLSLREAETMPGFSRTEDYYMLKRRAREETGNPKPRL